MRFRGNGAQRHGAGGKALDDLSGRFHLIDGNGLAGVDLELEQAAQGEHAARLVVDDLRVFLVGVVVVGARRMLQLGDGVGRPHVFFAAGAPGIVAACIEHIGEHGRIAEGIAVHAQRFFAHLEHADAFDLRGSAGEVFVHQRARQAHGLEDLRAAIAHISGDAHFGHHLLHALADGLDVVGDGLLDTEIARQVFGHCRNGVERQIRVHRLGAIACEHGEMMRFARAAGFHHQPGLRAQTVGGEVLMHRAQGKQRGNGHALRAHVAVGDDENVVAALERIHRFGANGRNARLDAFMPPGHRITDVEFEAAELAAGVLGNGAQPRHVVVVEHRLADFQPHGRIDLIDVEQIGPRADEGHQRHHHVLADRIDRRIGHLRE